MKIVVFELEEWEHDAFRKLGTDHEVLFTKTKLTDELLTQYVDADVISTFIYSDLSAWSLGKFANLRLIATRSTGYDHIDGSYCRQNGITVSNVPAYANRTVAEHVFALLLAISHKVPEAVERTRKGDFTQVGLQGFDLNGKTLGVIGTGSIGKAVIEIARGFRMEVIAYDIKPDEKAASLLGYHYATMDEVLASADIISLHIPANRRTRHLISTAAFSKMKTGAVLINTSRGQVVDIQALLHALVTRKIAAAGLDVLPEEPTIREESELLRSIFTKTHNLETLLADQILHHLPNVIVTPHSAFNTREAVQRLLDTTVENIIAFAAGKPHNVVVLNTLGIDTSRSITIIASGGNHGQAQDC